MTDDALAGIPYTWGFYGELSPVFLNYVCVLNGFRPVDIGGKFSYCELGSGNGLTANILAKCFPEGDFTAVDFDAAHVANANELAAAAAIENVKSLEIDFKTIEEAGLGTFDFITLHGVYAWIDADARAAVGEFIRGHLNPGGIVYISYDTLPGWAQLLPLRDAMASHTRPMAADTLTKAQAGIDYLQNLVRLEAGYFKDNPAAAAFVDEISRQDIKYVAHEFFAGTLEPLYFTEVAAAMGGLGLAYAGSAELNLNFIDLALPAEFHDAFRKISSREDYESQGDFVRNQRFRKDVFILGQAVLEADGQLSLLADIPFGTTSAADSFDRQVRFGDVELNYQGDIFDALIDALAAGARSANALMELPEFKEFSPALLVDGIKFLTAGGQMLPFGRKPGAPAPGAMEQDRFAFPDPLNLEILKRRLFQEKQIALYSPAARIGLEIPMAEALFILCLAEAPADQVAGHAFQRISESGRRMVFSEGTELDAVGAALAAFRETRLAKFIELGFLAPA